MAQQPNAATAISNIWKTTELKDKILFTLLCLLIYRLGSHVTVPGVDVDRADRFLRQSEGRADSSGCTTSSWAAGSPARRSSHSASCRISRRASSCRSPARCSRRSTRCKRRKRASRRVNQWTRYITVGLAVVQAWGFALFTESLPGAVANPGMGFKIEMVFFLTTGAIFVMWLGEQITERGIGNGASLIIFFSIIERFWPGIFETFRYVSTGATNVVKLIVLASSWWPSSPASSRLRSPPAKSRSRSRSEPWPAAGCAREPRTTSRSASMPQASCRSSSRSR